MSVSKLQAAGHHPKQKLKHWGSRLQKEQVALAETGVSTSEKTAKSMSKDCSNGSTGRDTPSELQPAQIIEFQCLDCAWTRV